MFIALVTKTAYLAQRKQEAKQYGLIDLKNTYSKIMFTLNLILQTLNSKSSRQAPTEQDSKSESDTPRQEGHSLRNEVTQSVLPITHQLKKQEHHQSHSV